MAESQAGGLPYSLPQVARDAGAAGDAGDAGAAGFSWSRRRWCAAAPLVAVVVPCAATQPVAASAPHAGSGIGSCTGRPPLQQPPADALQVHAFGARGDGLQDDTTAIQRALDALQRGQWLVFAAGRYRHARRLLVRHDCRGGVLLLQGDGTADPPARIAHES